jgi:hypothetical protein
VTQTVYKYPISFQEDRRVGMPEGAVVVAVGLDGNGEPCVWALVDPDKPVVAPMRKFGIYGTGGRVPDFWEYRGTFFQLPFVWHVFEEKLR